MTHSPCYSASWLVATFPASPCASSIHLPCRPLRPLFRSCFRSAFFSDLRSLRSLRPAYLSDLRGLRSLRPAYLSDLCGPKGPLVLLRLCSHSLRSLRSAYLSDLHSLRSLRSAYLSDLHSLRSLRSFLVRLVRLRSLSPSMLTPEHHRGSG